MSQAYISGIPTDLIDDGICLIFSIPFGGGSPQSMTTGFLHTPISASEPFGNPPVTWSSTSDLGSWVETVKYAARNGRSISIWWDDQVTNSYTTSYGGSFQLSALYAMSV